MLVPRGKLTTIEQSQALGEKIKYLMLVCNRPVAEIGLWRGGWGGGWWSCGVLQHSSKSGIKNMSVYVFQFVTLFEKRILFEKTWIKMTVKRLLNRVKAIYCLISITFYIAIF